MYHLKVTKRANVSTITINASDHMRRHAGYVRSHEIALRQMRRDTSPAYLQAIGDQGGARLVAQVRPIAVEAAADVGAAQADGAVVRRRRWR